MKYRGVTYGNVLWILWVKKTLLRFLLVIIIPQNPSYIDSILTISPLSFLSSGAIDSRLSDFHKMAAVVMKTTFQKLDPKIIHYRVYRKYCN